MKVNFTKEDVQSFRDIIKEYQDVSDELSSYQKKAEDIQTKIISLEKNLKSIKNKENKLMEGLHKKYGEFGLQDIYESLLMDNIKQR